MSIKILSETKRDLVESSPPKNCKAHLWLAEKTRTAINNKIQRNDVLDAYFSKRAEAKMRNHALSARKEKKEVMGVLLGEVKKSKEKTYIVARDTVTTDLDATNVSVRFDRAGFEKLFAGMDEAGFDYVIVGWYHSHPGHGCFMSSTDIETQKSMFSSPWHIAVVIDPLKFDVAAFALRGGKVEILTFAVYWRDFDDPYGGLERIRK